MKGWKSHLHADATPWLLEDNNPSVQYLTLTEILETPESQSEVQASRKNIMKTGVIPKFLAKQSPGGYWEKAGDFSGVFPCLTGNMTWGLIRFGHLDDPRVQRAIDWITLNSMRVLKRYYG